MFRDPDKFRFRRSPRPQKVEPARPVLDYEVPRPEPEDDADPPWWERLGTAIVEGGLELILTIGVVILLLWLWSRFG
jgi:hypothetical protein